MKDKILQGDAKECAKKLQDQSVDMVMTSPPYWALRDYGVENQLGLEKTPEQYIIKLVDIFESLKPKLKDTGTLWVNIGDTYGGSGNASGHKENTKNCGKKTKEYGATKGITQKLLPKSLIGIPFRFALAMIEKGWILRNTIIWHKRNCMPSSAKDRFTVDFEYIFFFSKKKKYYFKQQFGKISEAYKERVKYAYGENKLNVDRKMIGQPEGTKQINPKGRNKRTIWTINPKGFKGCHFAVFPEELCETPIDAGCPEFVCKKCGKPREQILEHNKLKDEGFDWIETNKSPYSIQERKGFVKVRKLPNLKEFSIYLNKNRKNTIDNIEIFFGNQAPHHWFSGESYPSKQDYLKLKSYMNLGDDYDESMTKEYYKPAEKQTLDYSEKGLTDCGCNTGFESGIVLDPFFGAGTTGVVAKKNGKHFIGFELNPEYINIAEKRIEPYLNKQLRRWII